MSRVSSTQNIILGAQFNVNSIGGPFEVFKGIIFHKFQNLDNNEFNLAWIGINLPPGYAIGGDILSKVTGLWFYGKKFFLLTAIYLAILCKLIDNICARILIRGSLGCIFFNFLSTIIMFIWIGTNIFFIYFATFFLVIIFFNKYSFKLLLR